MKLLFSIFVILVLTSSALQLLKKENRSQTISRYALVALSVTSALYVYDSHRN